MIADLQTASISRFPSFGDPKWVPGSRGRSPERSEAAQEAKNVRILVIDDEVLIGETVAEILNSEGFEATAVSDSAAAIELAKTLHPHIVLSDVIMPGMNGIETGIKIREIVPKCRVILFSGQAATLDLLAQARQQGHHFDIIAKPIRPEQLISLIRQSAGFFP